MAGIAVLLFCDLVDSTGLLARLGDDGMEDVRRAHLADIQAAVASGEGRVVKTLGDGAMAIFGSALGALRAAAGIQASTEDLNRARGEIGIAVRIGVAAGEPIADGEDVHGMAVVLASRLCAAAASGEVLVHDLVGALVASRAGLAFDPARSLELKGVPAQVSAAPLRWQQFRHEPADEGAGEPVLGEEGPTIPLPRLLASYVREPLVARDRQLGELKDALAAGSSTRAALVLGEPGIGKTHLAAQATSDAHAGGAVVVLARCQPELTVAFEPWVRAIGELALAGGDEWRERLAAAAGGELAALVPELAGVAGPASSTAEGGVVSAEVARYRLLRGVGAALAYAAGESPLVVVLDDAHWCDAASAQVLEHLIDGPVGSRIKLVLTARERDLGRGHPVSRAIADLRRTRELIEVRLDGLDDRGLVSLVAARVGRAITPAVASRLCARTAGNPFFAGELARELEQSGGLRDGDALEQAPVPDAVAGLVHERLARLSPETEQLLVAAAAIGPSAPVALAANAAGIPADQAEQAVGEAIGERLVDRVAAAEPTISFPHALVRESFEALVDDAERARLHLAVALELERRPQPEPAELARHFGLAAPVAGSERAISAYREAATAAANAHDHERAAAHLRSAIALIPAASISERAPLLLELGDQQLLAADLAHARDAYRAAADAFRGTGDACGLAAAALGFAGGDIGFGYELDNDDPTMMVLLREALDALGDSDPNLSVRLIFRLLYAMAYEDESAPRAELVAQARSFAERAGDPESLFFAKGARLIAEVGRTSEPTRVLDLIDHIELLLAEAEHVGRDDVLLRMLRLAAWASYCCRRIERCEQLIERMAIVADKLGTPRFTWEVDQARAERLTDRGERAQALGLVERAGATLRRLRPDLHLAIELTILAWSSAIYDDQISTSLAATESMGAATPWGMISAYATWWLALNGQHDAARDRLAELCAAEFETIRRPDIQFPTGLALLALAAAIVGDRETGNRLRPLLEPSRQYMLNGAPALFGGFLAVHALGRLALLAGDLDAAIDDLQTAVEWSDSVGSRVNSSWTRIDLAGAQHQRGDRAGAIETLAAAEQLASEYGMGLLIRLAREARDELEGRPVAPAAAPGGRARPVRALAARTGRRALAAFVRDQDDAALEARFAPARRQRALLRAMTRGFQPAAALGFTGVIAYELEPYAIESPPDAPWRWAIEVGKDGASVLEPAPLDAAVTIHFSLADWVRVMAGTQDPVTTMAAGRGSVEGDVLVASRLQPMFGAR